MKGLRPTDGPARGREAGKSSSWYISVVEKSQGVMGKVNGFGCSCFSNGGDSHFNTRKSTCFCLGCGIYSSGEWGAREYVLS